LNGIYRQLEHFAIVMMWFSWHFERYLSSIGTFCYHFDVCFLSWNFMECFNRRSL